MFLLPSHPVTLLFLWVLSHFSISVTTYEDYDTGVWQNQEPKVKTCYDYSWDCQEVLWAIRIRQPTTENPRIHMLGTETWWASLLQSSDPTIIKVGSKPSGLPGICCWPPWFDCEFTNRPAIGYRRISSVTILNFNNQTVHQIHHELSPPSSPQCSSPTKRSLCSQSHCSMWVCRVMKYITHICQLSWACICCIQAWYFCTAFAI